MARPRKNNPSSATSRSNGSADDERGEFQTSSQARSALIQLESGVRHVRYSPIAGLAIFEGSKHQYPMYDALAMGVQMMVFTYLLGRTDEKGRNVIEAWSDRVTKSKGQSVALSIVSVIVLANLLYGAVFAPHLVTKLGGYVTSGPSEQLFPGVPNQPK